MKRQLIRFACNNCGARLAVPATMGGRSDRCPKCREVITAPLESEEAVSTVAVEKAAPRRKVSSARQETLSPPELQPDLFQGLSPSLLDDFLAAPVKAESPRPAPLPPPSAEMPARPPAKPASPKPAPKLEESPHALLPHDLSEVLPPPAPAEPPGGEAPPLMEKREPPGPPAPPLEEPPPPPASPTPPPEPAPPPVAEATPPPLVEEVLPAPQWTPPPEEEDHSEDPLHLVGMGHVLEAHSTSQTLHTTRGKPTLGVDLMHLEALPGRMRRRKRALIFLAGISLILLVDLAMVIYRKEINAWWYRSRSTPSEVERAPASKPPPALDAQADKEQESAAEHPPSPHPAPTSETSTKKKTEPSPIAKREEAPEDVKKTAARDNEAIQAPPTAPSANEAVAPAAKSTAEERKESASASPELTASIPPAAPLSSGNLAGLLGTTTTLGSSIQLNQSPSPQAPSSPEKPVKNEASLSSPVPPAAPLPSADTEAAKAAAPDARPNGTLPNIAAKTETPASGEKGEASASSPPTAHEAAKMSSASPPPPLPVIMPPGSTAPAPIPLPETDGRPPTLLIPPPAPPSAAPKVVVKPESENESMITVTPAPVLTKAEATSPLTPPPLPSEMTSPTPEKTSGETPPAEAKPEPPPLPKATEVNITPAARPALEGLKKFLAAPNWAERLKYSQKQSSIRPIMEEHYKSYPDGPIAVGQIELKQRYPNSNGGTPYCMFELKGGALKDATVLALVEEPPGENPQVDWEVFTEFKDRLLWRFLETPSTSPQKFRVMLRRKHYFDKDVPDMDSKDSFMIFQPGADGEGHVFTPHGSKVSLKISQHLNWGNTIPATLELAWRKKDSHHWVEIASVAGFGWKN